MARSKIKYIFYIVVVTLFTIAIVCVSWAARKSVSTINSYTSIIEVPDKYKNVIHEDAHEIIIRSFQNDHWVTLEYSIQEDKVFDLLKKFNIELHKSSTLEIPNHKVSPDILEYVELFEKDYLSYSGSWGMGVFNIVYRRSVSKFYLSKSRI